MIYETQEELDAGLAKWQPRLYLQDWIIKSRLVEGDIIQGAAQCCVRFRLKESDVQLRRVEDFPTGSVFDNDMELDLVHELLHCIFEPVAPNRETKPRLYDVWEQIIDQIAKAMVAIDRQGVPRSAFTIFDTTEEAALVMDFWARFLRLNGWRFMVEVRPISKMAENAQAGSEITWRNRQAVIGVLQPSHWDYAWPQDMERSLVHELLHCHFDPLKPDWESEGGLLYEMWEQVIEDLAEIFVALARHAWTPEKK